MATSSSSSGSRPLSAMSYILLELRRGRAVLVPRRAGRHMHPVTARRLGLEERIVGLLEQVGDESATPGVQHATPPLRVTTAGDVGRASWGTAMSATARRSRLGGG